MPGRKVKMTEDFIVGLAIKMRGAFIELVQLCDSYIGKAKSTKINQKYFRKKTLPEFKKNYLGYQQTVNRATNENLLQGQILPQFQQQFNNSSAEYSNLSFPSQISKKQKLNKKKQTKAVQKQFKHQKEKQQKKYIFATNQEIENTIFSEKNPINPSTHKDMLQKEMRKTFSKDQNQMVDTQIIQPSTLKLGFNSETINEFFQFSSEKSDSGNGNSPHLQKIKMDKYKVNQKQSKSLFEGRLINTFSIYSSQLSQQNLPQYESSQWAKNDEFSEALFYSNQHKELPSQDQSLYFQNLQKQFVQETHFSWNQQIDQKQNQFHKNTTSINLDYYQNSLLEILSQHNQSNFQYESLFSNEFQKKNPLQKTLFHNQKDSFQEKQLAQQMNNRNQSKINPSLSRLDHLIMSKKKLQKIDSHKMTLKSQSHEPLIFQKESNSKSCKLGEQINGKFKTQDQSNNGNFKPKIIDYQIKPKLEHDFVQGTGNSLPIKYFPSSKKNQIRNKIFQLKQKYSRETKMQLNNGDFTQAKKDQMKISLNKTQKKFLPQFFSQSQTSKFRNDKNFSAKDTQLAQTLKFKEKQVLKSFLPPYSDRLQNLNEKNCLKVSQNNQNGEGGIKRNLSNLEPTIYSKQNKNQQALYYNNIDQNKKTTKQIIEEKNVEKQPNLQLFNMNYLKDLLPSRIRFKTEHKPNYWLEKKLNQNSLKNLQEATNLNCLISKVSEGELVNSLQQRLLKTSQNQIYDLNIQELNTKAARKPHSKKMLNLESFFKDQFCQILKK